MLRFLCICFITNFHTLDSNQRDEHQSKTEVDNLIKPESASFGKTDNIDVGIGPISVSEASISLFRKKTIPIIPNRSSMELSRRFGAIFHP